MTKMKLISFCPLQRKIRIREIEKPQFGLLKKDRGISIHIGEQRDKFRKESSENL